MDNHVLPLHGEGADILLVSWAGGRRRVNDVGGLLHSLDNDSLTNQNAALVIAWCIGGIDQLSPAFS